MKETFQQKNVKNILAWNWQYLDKNNVYPTAKMGYHLPLFRLFFGIFKQFTKHKLKTSAGFKLRVSE